MCICVADPASTLRAMAARGIAIRACADLGVPGAVRVAVPPPSRLDRVVEALSAALRGE